jgi:hypothetical protein
MRTLIFAIIFALTACDSSTNHVEKDSHKSTDSISKTNNNYSHDTTLFNNQNKFLLTTKIISDEKMLFIVSSNEHVTILDTIYYNGLAYIKYIDFDKDGSTDILLDYMGNNSTYFLYLFDQSSNSFKVIENYSSFPDAVQLKTSPKFYYSYHRAGCADMNWESDLFRIQDFKIIQIGHIDGIGCDYEVKENRQLIKIYKVTNNDEQKGKLIENLPYLKVIPNFGDKWDFIEKYWNKNYAKFE